MTRKLCHEFHAQHHIPCQRTDCRLWDEQMPQNCTAIQAKKGPHTLQDIADLKMLPRIDGKGFQLTKPAVKIEIDGLLQKGRNRCNWGRQVWMGLHDLWSLEETE